MFNIRSTLTLLWLAFAGDLQAATFTVDTTNPSNIAGCTATPGDCSFNGAIGAERNVISGNGNFGVQIGLPNGGCGNTIGALIRGNYIGAAADGIGLIGNGLLDSFQRGNVLLRTRGAAGAPNIVGGSELGAANLILGGVGSGVHMQDSAFSAAIGNRVRDNRKLGIDVLSNAIREPNDLGDADAVQNFPVIQAFAISANQVNLSYLIDTAVTNAVYPRGFLQSRRR
jgi:hypothetical protein